MSVGTERNGRVRMGVVFTALAGVLLLVVLLFMGKQENTRHLSSADEELMSVDIEVIDNPVDAKAGEAREPAAASPEQAAASVPADGAGGALPPLQANYRRLLGFTEYARRMTRMGAGFYLFGGGKPGFLRIDPVRRTAQPVDTGVIKAAGYSPRSRTISDEPALEWALDEAEEEYGMSNPEILLLVPRSMEDRIASNLSSSLTQDGVSLEEVIGLRGHYAKGDGKELALVVTQAYLANGESVDVNIDALP